MVNGSDKDDQSSVQVFSMCESPWSILFPLLVLFLKTVYLEQL